MDFFRAFTPVDELALLEIGSRPTRRPESADFLGSLRAIPWVFAWTQNRTILPAWFGSGTALGSLVEAGQVDALRRLYARLPFFRSLVDTLEMTLAKSSLEIASQYVELVPAELEPERLYAGDRLRARADGRRRACRRWSRARCSNGSRCCDDRSSCVIRTSIR